MENQLPRCGARDLQVQGVNGLSFRRACIWLRTRRFRVRTLESAPGIWKPTIHAVGFVCVCLKECQSCCLRSPPIRKSVLRNTVVMHLFSWESPRCFAGFCDEGNSQALASLALPIPRTNDIVAVLVGIELHNYFSGLGQIVPHLHDDEE